MKTKIKSLLVLFASLALVPNSSAKSNYTPEYTYTGYLEQMDVALQIQNYDMLSAAVENAKGSMLRDIPTYHYVLFDAAIDIHEGKLTLAENKLNQFELMQKIELGVLPCTKSVIEREIAQAQVNFIFDTMCQPQFVDGYEEATDAKSSLVYRFSLYSGVLRAKLEQEREARNLP